MFGGGVAPCVRLLIQRNTDFRKGTCTSCVILYESRKTKHFQALGIDIFVLMSWRCPIANSASRGEGNGLLPV